MDLLTLLLIENFGVNYMIAIKPLKRVSFFFCFVVSFFFSEQIYLLF